MNLYDVIKNLSSLKAHRLNLKQENVFDDTVTEGRTNENETKYSAVPSCHGRSKIHKTPN